MSDLPTPGQPYRSAALVHGLLAGAIVVVAWLSEGSLDKAIVVAAVYFVVATGWTWFRLRQKERQPAREPSRPGDGGDAR